MADPYADKITDPGNLRMRSESGRVDDFRPLVAFLYELARDLVPTGKLEDRIDRLAVHAQADESGERGPFMFTNGWLARWAQDVADRLAEPRDPVAEQRSAEVARLLHELDGHLGLAVHRGEGSSARWKEEANNLITRIRRLR